jgi:N-ethylmaleimide reductase
MSVERVVLKPASVGGLNLKNRIVMAPLTRSRASRDGIQPPYAADYYAQRAGCALIVTEATNISPQAVGYAGTPGIWNEAQVASWRSVTDAVHQKDGLIFLQLWHTGRVSHESLQPGGQLPVSASAIGIGGMAPTYDGPCPVPPRAPWRPMKFRRL